MYIHIILYTHLWFASLRPKSCGWPRFFFAAATWECHPLSPARLGTFVHQLWQLWVEGLTVSWETPQGLTNGWCKLV